MAKEAIKEITINKDKKNAELCISIELLANEAGTLGRDEVQRKKVRVQDMVELLKSHGHNPGRCTSNPGQICNTAGPAKAAWRFEDLDTLKLSTKSNRKSPSTRKTKTA